MKKAGVKIASKEAKKVVKAAIKQEVRKEERKVHKAGAKPARSPTKSVISSSMRGQKTYNAPVSVGMSTRSYFQVKNLTSGKYKGGVRIMGRDYFSTITWTTSATPGEVLVNVPLNPSALSGTRLAQFTELYEKYRFNKFKVFACPTSSTNISGAYGMSYDRDPSDATPGSGDTGIRTFMSFEGSTTASAWLQSELAAPLMEPTTDYFVNAVSGGDERLVDQGQFYAWVYTACSQNTSIALEIEYDLTLYIPQTTGTVGSAQYGASTTASTKKMPQSGPVARGWQPLNQLASGSTGMWNTQITLGDIAKIVGISSATANFAIQIAGGLYTLYQGLDGIATAAVASTTYSWTVPAFVANKAEEQDLFAVDPVSQVPGVFDGSTQVVATSRLDNLYIPPSGGLLYGWFLGDVITDAVLLQSGASLDVILGPCFSSVSGTSLFSPMLGKPGKFGDAHRKKWREYLSAKEEKRLKLKSVKEKGADPASVSASSVVPRDNPDATQLARAEALQAAAKLLGIK